MYTAHHHPGVHSASFSVLRLLHPWPHSHPLLLRVPREVFCMFLNVHIYLYICSVWMYVFLMYIHKFHCFLPFPSVLFWGSVCIDVWLSSSWTLTSAQYPSHYFPWMDTRGTYSCASALQLRSEGPHAWPMQEPLWEQQTSILGLFWWPGLRSLPSLDTHHELLRFSSHFSLTGQLLPSWNWRFRILLLFHKNLPSGTQILKWKWSSHLKRDPVFISYCCCNQVPQPQCLNTANLSSCSSGGQKS